MYSFFHSLNYKWFDRASEIAKATDFLKDWDAYTPTPWLPIIDAKHVKKDPFIPENPIELIKKGNFNKMPTLIGHTKNEGIYTKCLWTSTSKKYNPW